MRWELVKQRKAAGLDGQLAIIPMERLYPLPANELAEVLAPYTNVTDVRWVQEEPENQGAWYYMLTHLPGAMSEKLPGFLDSLTAVTRPPSSAPSVGQHSVHVREEQELLEKAMA